MTATFDKPVAYSNVFARQSDSLAFNESSQNTIGAVSTALAPSFSPSQNPEFVPTLWYTFVEGAFPFHSHGSASLDLISYFCLVDVNDASATGGPPGLKAAQLLDASNEGGMITVDQGSLGQSVDITISCWVNVTALVDGAPIITKQYFSTPAILSRSVSINLSGTSGGLSFSVRKGQFTGSLSCTSSAGDYLSVNKWYYVVMTYNRAAGVLCGYINGKLVATASQAPGTAIDWGMAGNWEVVGGYFSFNKLAMIAEVSIEPVTHIESYILQQYNAYWPPPVVVVPPIQNPIDTSVVDPYVQGVEITRQSQYDAGTFKIWSGDAGHVLKKANFGQVNVVIPGEVKGFVDTGPILGLRSMDGVLEPLTIAPGTSPVIHTVRGAFGVGNLDQRGASDQVLTVDVFDTNHASPAFCDVVSTFGGVPTGVESAQESFAQVNAFNDQRLVRSLPVSENGVPNDMLGVLSSMTGSADSCVHYDERSACSGWQYDNNAFIGTDSVTFGGMTH